METLYYILKSLLYSTTCIIQSNHHTTVSQHARHKSKDPCRSCSVIQEGPKFNDRCALKGQERRRPHEDGNRDWSDATTSQGNQQPWEGRRGKEGSLPRTPGGGRCDLANILISVTWPPDCGRLYFCCYQPSSSWSFVSAALGSAFTLLHTLLFVEVCYSSFRLSSGAALSVKAPLTSPGRGGLPCSGSRVSQWLSHFPRCFSHCSCFIFWWRSAVLGHLFHTVA